MMEFEELQQIWDEQQSRSLYVLDEAALHRRIVSKQQKSRQIFYFSELLLIAVNLGVGIMILSLKYPVAGRSIFRDLLAGWMFATALYVLVNLFRRLYAGHKFDRSMLGDLDHAIAFAGYQVNLSRIMRWNMLPLCALMVLWLWDAGEHPGIVASTAAVLLFAFFASGREHRYYLRRKRELDELRKKLEANS